MIRVTSEANGIFINRMYSYWSNAWVEENIATVFVGDIDGQVQFFRVHLDSGSVEPLGSLVPYFGTGEGWYWCNGWIYLPIGTQLRRYHPFFKIEEVLFDFGDASYRLWQAHSSEDGLVHSATVQRIVSDGPYPNIGTVVSQPGRLSYFPAVGTLDESQVDASGQFVIIKENDDNRIITLASNEERLISDAEGALGHSDCGAGFAVGEDNQTGVAVRLDLATFERQPLFPTWNMGHVSVRGQRCLFSDPLRMYLLDLDVWQSRELNHGMVGSDYDHQVMANLDATGRTACFVSNMGTDRFDAYIVTL